MKNLLTSLQNPQMKWRGTPFWSWNAKLDKQELVRQVHAFKHGGFGGFFMHVRCGLATEYLSAEFLDCVKVVVAEAKKLGLYAWLYDEDRWSSGFGAGMVTKNPDYRVKALVWEAIPREKFTVIPADALRCFSARVTGNEARAVRPFAQGDRLPPGASLIVFRVVATTGHPWYNFTSYVDTMNPDATQEFIRCTHEVYKQAVGSEFGKTIPGIFTDEPNYGGFSLSYEQHRRAYPWTGRFAAEFRKRMGYDVLDRLVEISHRVDGLPFSSVRMDYRRVATELYVEAYTKPIYEWCQKNKLEFTGHELAESELEAQADRVGSCMQHYEWFHRPGIDILCDVAPELLSARQVVSVASQMGRNRVLCEIYGCTGWDATFEMYKHIGDWHQVLGINHFCHHLSWYSMAGEGKRDYPASIFYQSPWWKHNKLLADYFARISQLLSQGTAVREVCVIHPLETAWGAHVKFQPGVTYGVTELLQQLSDALLDGQFDFEFADESHLPRHGAITGKDGTARLRVGKMSYRVVIVPECLTLRSATVALLEKFARAGGRLVFLGRTPAFVDGKPSDRVARLAAKCICAPLAPSQLAYTLGDDARHVVVRRNLDVNSEPHAKAWIHLRRVDDAEVLFVVNMNRQLQETFRICWTGDGRISEVDLMTGNVSAVPGVEAKDGKQTFVAELHPTGSRMYLRRAGKPVATQNAGPATETDRIRLSHAWSFRLDEPNAMNLDYARMRVLEVKGGGAGQISKKWRPRRLLWQHDEALRAELDFTSGSKGQPYLWLKKLSPKSAMIELAFEIPVEHAPTGPISLVLEHPERFAISINGKTIKSKPDGWFIDRSFKVVPLHGVKLRKGGNELVLRTEYRQDHLLEEIYLTGMFGVKIADDRPIITQLPKKLTTGDWRYQGLAMYSGAVTYSQPVRLGAATKGRRFTLCMEHLKATVLEVCVNGRKCGVLWGKPWKIDITDAVRGNAVNRLDITVVSSRRNLLGPLHHAAGNPTWTGAGELHPSEKYLVQRYNLVGYGLLGEVSIVVEKC